MPSQRLRRQLPIWIALVMATTIVATAWTAYYDLHRSILASAGARLEAAAEEVATLLRTSMARPRNETAQLAKDAALSAVLADQNSATVAAAQRVLTSARAANRSIGGLALWSADGHQVVADGPAKLIGTTRPLKVPTSDSGSIGRIVATDSGFAYSVMAPVRIRGQVVGVLVRAQPSTASSGGGSALIARLVGRGSRLLMGNADDSVWTDFAKVVPAPAARAGDEVVEFEGADGTAFVGKVTRVADTPWAIWVELPESSSSLEAVHAIRTRGLVIVLVLGLLGAFASGMVVRRVARDVDSRELADRAALLESKNAELRQSEIRFRQLVDHLPDALIVHRGGRIVFANPGGARVLGLESVDQLLGRSILEFVHTESMDTAPGMLGMTASHQVSGAVDEIRLVRADKSEVTAEVSSMPVTFDEQMAVQTIMRDVTERRLLEDQFRQSQKMDAVGRLAGGIAHDFNNLLTVIHTYADITLHATPLTDPRRADLQEILHAAKSAAGLTRQMLAFSRKQVLEPRRIDVNEATTGVIKMIKRVIGEHIEVSTSLRDGIHPIWADAGQLEQVLMNLAVNARDAMPAGGLLKIETANVHLESGYASYHGHAIPAGDYVLLSVADTGAGMTEEVQRKIFEPFFTTKEPGKGTGLGLATVYGIIKQSEGFIWVYSEPGQGTVFKIYFPRYTGDAEPAALPIPDPLRHDRVASILLVEDEPHVRAAVRRILESRRFTVIEADRPSTALAIFKDRSQSIDLVLTDMMMPERNGAELVRELTAIRPDVRAIIMSGYSEEATSRQWRLPPNALFIEKPLEPAELFRKMNEAFGWRD